MTKIIFILIFLPIFFSCSPQEQKSLKGNDEISLEVQKALNNYFDDIRKNGMLAEFNWFDDSGDFYWVPPLYRSPLSYDSVRTILEQNAKGNRSADLEWKTLKILPLAENIANYTGTIDATMIDSAGVSTTIHLIETGTVVKRKNGWKLLCGQTAVIE